MTLDEFDAFCAALPHSTFVRQWGDAHVWKIGGKVYAMGRSGEDGEVMVTFKATEMGFEILSDAPGCRPAPYMASRGLKWIQRTGPETLGDAELKAHVEESRRMVGAKLSKAKRAELGLSA
ncbi:MmcQ/YjbR family DNA-binding protein [Rhodovulum sp. DZ06]|uniref:MmcQ/YjbR family DNA-binding protein n=1 Tax=Rhodovulum sp. DZ06 TaxID=3425126 RepID=UPI003D34EFAF